MKGKSVLITGGARRIGREIGLRMAAAGADVAFTYLSSAEDAGRTLAELKSRGVRALAIRCDLREETNVVAALRQVQDEFGGLDVLVNNAGSYETVDFEEISLRQWDEMFATNTRAPFLLSRLAAPSCENAKGASSTLRRWAACARGRVTLTTAPRRRRSSC